MSLWQTACTNQRPATFPFRAFQVTMMRARSGALRRAQAGWCVWLYLLGAQLLDECVELAHFVFGQVGQGCAHRTCAVTDQLRTRLHDTDRVARATIADGQLGQEEFVDQLARRFVVV